MGWGSRICASEWSWWSEAFKPLELELQLLASHLIGMLVSHLIGMLGTEPESSARAVCPLITEPSLGPILFHLENDLFGLLVCTQGLVWLWLSWKA